MFWVLLVWLFPTRTALLLSVSFPMLPFSQLAIDRVPILSVTFGELLYLEGAALGLNPYKSVVQFLVALGLSVWFLALLPRVLRRFITKPPFSLFFLFVILIMLGNFTGLRIERTFFLWFIGMWGPFLCVLFMFSFTYRYCRDRMYTVIDFAMLGYLILCLVSWMHNRSSAAEFQHARAGMGIYSGNFAFPILVMWIPFVMHRFLTRDWKRAKWPMILFLVLTSVLLMLSLSRGALLFTVLSVGLCLLVMGWSRINRKLVAFAVIACTAIAVFTLPVFSKVVDSYTQRIFGARTASKDTDTSLDALLEASREEDRMSLISYSIELWKTAPVFGWGLGNFSYVSPIYYSSAHNLTFNLLVENGLVGMLGFWLMILILTIRMWVRKVAERVPWTIGLLCFVGIASTTGAKLVQASILFSGLTLFCLFLILSLPEYPEVSYVGFVSPTVPETPVLPERPEIPPSERIPMAPHPTPGSRPVSL